MEAADSKNRQLRSHAVRLRSICELQIARRTCSLVDDGNPSAVSTLFEAYLALQQVFERLPCGRYPPPAGSDVRCCCCTATACRSRRWRPCLHTYAASWRATRCLARVTIQYSGFAVAWEQTRVDYVCREKLNEGWQLKLEVEVAVKAVKEKDRLSFLPASPSASLSSRLVSHLSSPSSRHSN